MAPVPKALKDLVTDAAIALGRGPTDGAVHAQTLVDNWFDTPESLAKCDPDNLAKLGIPLRFAQQVVNLAVAAGGESTGQGEEEQQQEEQHPEPRGSAGAQQGYKRSHEDSAQGDAGGSGGWRQYNSRRDDYGKADRREDYSRDSRNQVKSIAIKHMEFAFGARGSILGPSGQNVRHIQDQTGAKVDLKDDPNEKHELVFRDAPNDAALRDAMRMGKDLLQAVYTQYDEWLQDGRPDIKGRGKGGYQRDYYAKGEGKGKKGKDGGKKPTRQHFNDKLQAMEFQHSIEIAACDANFAFWRKMVFGRGYQDVREIEKQTGALLQLDGNPGEAMLLQLGSKSQESLTMAVELAEALVVKVYNDYEEWLANGGVEGEEAAEGEQKDQWPEYDYKDKWGGGKGGKKKKTEEKLAGCEFQTTMEIQECDPGYSIRYKITAGRKLKKLEEDTGAVVQLQGNEGEALSLTMGATSQEALDLATTAAENLLLEVYDDYANWQENGGMEQESESKGKGKSKADRGVDRRKGGEPKGKGKGKDKGKGGKPDFKKMLTLKECDPSFEIGKKLRGARCENLHHIQDRTGARLWVLDGSATEPVRLEISAFTNDEFEEAIQMSKDLIKTLFIEYGQWSRDGGESASKRQRTW